MKKGQTLHHDARYQWARREATGSLFCVSQVVTCERLW